MTLNHFRVLGVVLAACAQGCSAPTESVTTIQEDAPAASAAPQPSAATNSIAVPSSAVPATSAAPSSPASTTSTTFGALDIAGLSGGVLHDIDGDLFITQLPAGERTRLTDHEAPDFDGEMSPDGTRVAFRSHRDGDEEVYIVDALGGSPENLTHSPEADYSPSWSPDGTQLAFMSARGGNPNIWVMGADGSDPRQVTDLPGISEYPSWSPDGTRLVFHCSRGVILPSGVGDFELCVVDAASGKVVQITDTDGENKLPAWSPAGDVIAFQSSRDGFPEGMPPEADPADFGDFELYTIRPDGTGEQRVTTNPREHDAFVTWSPDGAYLLYTGWRSLKVATPDGAAGVPLEVGGAFPDWFA